MKIQMIIMFFVMIVLQTTTLAGKESGGGNPYLSDFRNRARYIVSKNVQGLLSEVEIKTFKSYVENEQPIATTGRLFHPQKGQVIAKLVFNGSLTNEDLSSLSASTIEWLKLQPKGKRFLFIDIESWMRIVDEVSSGKKVIDLLQFVFHEYLQLSGFDDTNDNVSSKLRLVEEGYQVWKNEQLENELNKINTQNIVYEEVVSGEAFYDVNPEAKKLSLLSHAERCEKWKSRVKELYRNRIVFLNCGLPEINGTNLLGKAVNDIIWYSSSAKLVLSSPKVRTLTVTQPIFSEKIIIPEENYKPLVIDAIKSWQSACDSWVKNVVENSYQTPLYVSCGTHFNTKVNQINVVQCKKPGYSVGYCRIWDFQAISHGVVVLSAD